MSEHEKLHSQLQKLRQENFYLHNIIKKIPSSVYWKDKQGVYLGCNNFVLDMAGSNDVVGKTDFDLPWGDSASEIQKIDQQVMETGIPLEVEEVPKTIDGKQLVMLTYKAPLVDEHDNVTGIIGISVDITDRKQLEADLMIAKDKAEVANQAKSEFIANMSHDFITALTSITGLSDLLIEGKSQDEQNEYLHNIKAASETLLSLINDVLAFSKSEHQKNQVRQEVVSLPLLMNNVSAMLNNQALEKILALNFAIPVDKKILSDNSRLTRILMNIIGNAIKFTQTGHVDVTAELTAIQHYDADLKITVSDTGIGIPVDKHAEIFERFNRLDPAYKGHASGAGLGLSIAKQFVDDLNGTISLTSKPGEGATFTIIIPCKLVDDAQIQEENNLIPPSILETKTKHILLVEDNMIVAEITKRHLTDLNCHVDIAYTAKQALEKVSDKHDLVLLDIGLPDRDGFYVAKNIRNRGDEVHNIPIIAHTAHIASEEKQQAFEAGMNDFLTKPTNKAQLEEIIVRFEHSKKLNGM